MTSTANRRDGNKNNGAGTSAIATSTTATTGGSPNSDGIRIRSCLAGPDNPKTILRKQLDESGNSNVLHFDERVVVHTVPYWDPCGPVYHEDDDTDESRGCDCCTIM